jgi:hypothetical protein
MKQKLEVLQVTKRKKRDPSQASELNLKEEKKLKRKHCISNCNKE